ncbi:hypothetical protein Tco_1284107 [Tanacetum coccineum]
MNKKSYSFDLDTFRNMLQMCPKLPGQEFVDPPFKEEILTFMRDLGYPGNIKLLSDVKVDTLPQPWRTFGTIINKCLSGKVIGIDTLRLSRAQILWGLYHQQKVNYVYLLWEDLVYQIENKESRKNKYMFYPRFTKVIINHFMSQDQSIPRRNKVDWHMANDDPILTTMRFIPQHEVVQRYGAILPDNLTTQVMKESEAYKTYHDLATGKVQPKQKYVRRSSRSKTEQAPKPSAGKRVKAIAKKSSDEEDDDDEANVSKDEDDDNQDDDEVNVSEHEDDNDDERTESDNDGDEFVHLKFTTHDDEATHEKEVNKEDSFDPRVHTPSRVESTDDEDNDDEIQDANIEGEKMDEDTTNETKDTHVILTAPINPEGQQHSSSVSSGFISNMLNPRQDTGIDLIFTLNTEATSLVDVPVTTLAELTFLATTTLPPPPTPLIIHLHQTPVLTPANVPSSSLQDLPNFGSLFGFVHRLKALEDNFSEFKQTNQFAEAVFSILGIIDKYMENKMNEAVKVADQVKEQVKDQVTKILPRIEKSVTKQLEAKLKKILIDKMESNKSIHRSDEQKNLYTALVAAYESDKLILDTYGDTVSFKRCRDDEDKDEEPSAGSNRGSKRRRARKEPVSTSVPKEKTSKALGKLTKGSKSHHRTAGESTQAEEPMHTAKDLEEPTHQEFKTGVTEDQPNEEPSQFSDWFQKPTRLPSPDRDWNKTLPDAHRPAQPWLSDLAHKEDPRESFDELMDTPLDFSAFIMNQLKVDTLTPELLTGPTFELMKGTCKSLVELEYFFEEVYKATTEQLDWINPKGQQYLHDLRKPLPLILNSQGLRVIPFDHFINNELEYLSGGVSSRKYATSSSAGKLRQTCTLGILTLGRKRQKFYAFAANRESAKDVYSKCRIIAVTKLEIVEWHNYMHLDWITKRCHPKACGRSLTRCQKLPKEAQPQESDTYRPDLKRREAYSAYFNRRGFIYQNKDKKNRLIRIDELHKFSDGTLDDVWTALNDRLKVGDRTRVTSGCYRGPYDLSYIVLIIKEHAEFDESNAYVLERFYTLAGNPVKEILLKLSLPDHRILKDGGEDFHYSDTKRLSRSDEVLKLKNFMKDATLKLFNSTNQERYEHVGPEVTSSQDGKVIRWRNKIMLG